MLFGHGDDYFNSAEQIAINFSSNIWHGADLRPLKEHLFSRFDAVTRYPEPDAASLRLQLAHLHNVEEDHLVVTNGSTTAFYLLAQIARGAKSIIAIPSFAEYEDACRMYEHSLRFFSNSEDITSLDFTGQDYCWICNPNNPDGRWWGRDELSEVIRKNPQTVFILDQAYVPFTSEEVLGSDDIKRNGNLVIIRSISKAYDIPGLRMGYIMASPSIVDKVNRCLIPWSVNAFAIESAKYILRNPDRFVLPLQQWQRETETFRNELNRIDGVEALPTSTTFFLGRITKGNSTDLKNYLLHEHIILIRDASNFRGLGDSYIRLSTQSEAENMKLVEAIKEWMATLQQ